ncbi:MAG: hypothetical protein NTZ02_02795 [Candidatus Woesearchaeota archaeon]|nr:hypothetical protein [Candidatus Woesearchaeota archaeon]
MFIKIGKRILDFDNYRKQVSLIKRYAESDIEALFGMQGFELRRKESREDYDKLFLELYNPELKIRIVFEMEREEEEILEE